jgi:hypothetical protein
LRSVLLLGGEQIADHALRLALALHHRGDRLQIASPPVKLRLRL